MANLNETDEWFDGVYQLEEDDPVLGGPAGIDNLAPRQLASRSRYLRLRNVTPWAAALAYPADVAYVSHGNTTWKSVAASTGVEPGTDATKWVRWAHTAAELAEALGDAVAAHEAKPDPHPQYATDADLAAHAAAADPHAGYVPWAFAAAAATAAGLVPDRAVPTQLAQAIPLLAPGRFIARRVFTTNQVYTPTAGTRFVDVLVIGGGGGGGGAQSTTSTTAASGAGGGGGGWARKRIPVASASGAAMTIGAGGAGGITTNNGGNGGTTSFGAQVSATGGSGGPYGPQNTISSNASFTLGVAGQGSGSGGDMNGHGEYGGWAFYASNPQSGKGGSSIFGGGGIWRTGYATGGDGNVYGAGGGGGNCPPNTGGATGGSGAAGVIVVEEYA